MSICCQKDHNSGIGRFIRSTSLCAVGVKVSRPQNAGVEFCQRGKLARVRRVNFSEDHGAAALCLFWFKIFKFNSLYFKFGFWIAEGQNRAATGLVVAPVLRSPSPLDCVESKFACRRQVHLIDLPQYDRLVLDEAAWFIALGGQGALERAGRSLTGGCSMPIGQFWESRQMFAGRIESCRKPPESGPHSKLN